MVNKPLKPLCLREFPRLEDILEDRIDISRYLYQTKIKKHYIIVI